MRKLVDETNTSSVFGFPRKSCLWSNSSQMRCFLFAVICRDSFACSVLFYLGGNLTGPWVNQISGQSIVIFQS